MRLFLLIVLVALLGACQSSQRQEWQMYRLDKHYQPYRVR
jgi:hypothetical protein